MRRPQFSERIDRGQARFSRCLRIVDVAHRDFHGDVRSVAQGRDFDDRDTSLPRSRKAKRRVRGNCRWDEDGSPPAGGFEKPVQPSHRDRLWIERHEPCECADLGPNIPNLTRDTFGGMQVFRPTCRDPAQEKWNNPKSRRGAACLGEQTWKARFISGLPFQHSCRYMPTTCLKLRPRRGETVCHLLADLRGPPKGVV